jgi:A/G-specific adenine glycosylase
MRECENWYGGKRCERCMTAKSPSIWPASWRKTARRRLLGWYRRNARDLSWRRTSDPYAIWVSEIMLQQTQVATVERYFERFLAALPTIHALATAREDRVLRLWEGLGYYRRARNMHAAAKKIVAEHRGIFPREMDAVRRLPGVGRYTAGAILSIAFDAQTPILEANTIRLLSRLLGYRGAAKTVTAQKLLWKAAESLLPRRGCGELNQALMELGSLICTPQKPRCAECPLVRLCRAQRNGVNEDLKRKSIKAPEKRHEVAVLIEGRGKVLLRKCGDGEWWSGLWDFPRFRVAPSQTTLQQQVKEHVRRLAGLKIRQPKPLATLRHGVTRYRITLHAYVAKCAGPGEITGGTWRWVRSREIEKYPLNSTGRKLAQIWMDQRQLAHLMSR